MLTDSIKNCKILSVTSKMYNNRKEIRFNFKQLQPDENEIQQIYLSFLLILSKNPDYGDCFTSI